MLLKFDNNNFWDKFKPVKFALYIFQILMKEV